MLQQKPLEVSLARARESDKSTLANLMQLYRYDLSAFNDDELDASGKFSLG